MDGMWSWGGEPLGSMLVTSTKSVSPQGRQKYTLNLGLCCVWYGICLSAENFVWTTHLYVTKSFLWTWFSWYTESSWLRKDAASEGFLDPQGLVKAAKAKLLGEFLRVTLWHEYSWFSSTSLFFVVCLRSQAAKEKDRRKGVHEQRAVAA